jgi:hypothetical protein
MKPQHFPLTVSYFCQDCKEVGNSSRSCACCGSRSLLSLANVLNRESLDDYGTEKALYEIEKQETMK